MTDGQKYRCKQGVPTPLGSCIHGSHVNFALYSAQATRVQLALFTPASPFPFLEIELDPNKNKTGSVWHIAIENLPSELEYGYKIEGTGKGVLLDPYARAVHTPHHWGGLTAREEDYLPRARATYHHKFDWEGVEKPHIPLEDLLIYEMHVRGFTEHPSSKVKHRGSFLGMIEKIPYLKKLGVNAVELLPIFEFNECENHLKDPQTGKHLHNYWGYSTVNFFSPMNRFASSSHWDAALEEWKMLVKELHKNHIEVILDVVYNHTAEGNETGPVLSFKGIDNATYYMLTKEGQYQNFSGTGNTFNCNHPVVAELILESLRYWATEMQVDGFRFDLASILTRAPDGTPLSNPPLIEAINKDPLLAKTKLIAEAWDAHGLYQVGSFPGGNKWSEWNGKYRDVVRRFIKGTDGQVGAFAQALCGSQDLYAKEGSPLFSINFITAHDGYSLRDLVSYQDKHNGANGENNQDGANQNDSWNCGAEGKTESHTILLLRERQIKNFHAANMVSLGVPMILMGDEYTHTRHGNNNPYCQDNELNWFLWEELDKHHREWRFFSELIHFRKRHKELFCKKNFLTKEDIDWHGIVPFAPDWGGSSRFIAYTLHNNKTPALYVAFNAHFEPAKITLPPLPQHKHWFKVVDTALVSPHDIEESPQEHPPLKFVYTMESYSCLIATAL